MSAFRCIITGAAGRDFHDFAPFFRARVRYRAAPLDAVAFFARVSLLAPPG
jgi:hypothetical protein